MDAKHAGIRQWLVPALARLAPTFAGTITDETPLGEDGLCLDSITLVDLIAEIERQQGVHISEEQVSLENFGTVGRLVSFISTLD